KTQKKRGKKRKADDIITISSSDSEHEEPTKKKRKASISPKRKSSISPKRKVSISPKRKESISPKKRRKKEEPVSIVEKTLKVNAIKTKKVVKKIIPMKEKLWPDKYATIKSSELLGNAKQIDELIKFLKNWEKNVKQAPDTAKKGRKSNANEPKKSVL